MQIYSEHFTAKLDVVLVRLDWDWKQRHNNEHSDEQPQTADSAPGAVTSGVT